MKFNYTYHQKNGFVSKAQIELDEVIHAKIVQYKDSVLKESGEQEEVVREAITLTVKYNVQQPMELPIEQPKTKEDKALGRRNVSHSKWELGWFPWEITVGEESEVNQLKEILNLK